MRSFASSVRPISRSFKSSIISTNSNMIIRSMIGSANQSFNQSIDQSKRFYRVTTIHLPQLSPSMISGTIDQFHNQSNNLAIPAQLIFTLSTDTLLADDHTNKPKEQSNKQSSNPGHIMEVECHDSGYIAMLGEASLVNPEMDRSNNQSKEEQPKQTIKQANKQAKQPTKQPIKLSINQSIVGLELPVNTIVGFMFDDEEVFNKHQKDIPVIQSMIQSINQSINQSVKLSTNQSNDNLSINQSNDQKDIELVPFLWQAYVNTGEKQTGSCTPEQK